MPRVAPEAFGEREAIQLYVARALDEAKRVEEALEQTGLDYVIEVEPVVRTVLSMFVGPRNGAAFYVLPESAGAAFDALEAAGLTGGLVAERP